MKFLIPIFLLLNFQVHSQVLPSHNNLPELGLSFDVPEGWTAQMIDSKVIMGHNKIAGIIILATHELQNTQDLLLEANKGMYDTDVNLEVKEVFKVVDENKISGEYEGSWEGVNVRSYGIGYVNEMGVGVNILVITTVEQFTNQHKLEAEKVANSIAFFKPETSQQTTNWTQKLVPSLIKYISSQSSSDYSGGMTSLSSVEEITLCSNGSFGYYSNAHAGVTSDSGFANSNSNSDGYGNYKIYTVMGNSKLELVFNSGEVYLYELVMDYEGSTFLNNTRYFVVETDNCQ